MYCDKPLKVGLSKEHRTSVAYRYAGKQTALEVLHETNKDLEDN